MVGGLLFCEEGAQVEVISHHDDGGLDLFDVAAVRFRVMRQRQVHLLLDADVVDDQSPLLVLKLPVHPRDRLDQIVPLDRLVDVDGIEEWHIKARQPHVHHDGDFEIGFRLLRLGIELLALVLVAEQVVERLLVVLAEVLEGVVAVNLFSAPAPLLGSLVGHSRPTAGLGVFEDPGLDSYVFSGGGIFGWGSAN